MKQPEITRNRTVDLVKTLAIGGGRSHTRRRAASVCGLDRFRRLAGRALLGNRQPGQRAALPDGQRDPSAVPGKAPVPEKALYPQHSPASAGPAVLGGVL